MTMLVRDDFAGPGGWDVALRALGITNVVGVEMDNAANDTAEANGFRRIRGDVRTAWTVSLRPLWGYVASPPCQTYSPAGLRGGQASLPLMCLAVAMVFDGWNPDAAVAHLNAQGAHMDERSVLVLHPATVIRDYGPEWVALEQVKAVKPVWEAYAEQMRHLGYSVVTDVLHAEQYGVPQTRDRAILIARRDGREAVLPTPTHSRYYSRTPAKLDDGVLPWVSMAEALTWGMTHRPAMTVATGTAAGGTDPACVGGSGARATLHRERDAGRWFYNGNQANSAVRHESTPAPTIHFGGRANAVTWQESGDIDPREILVTNERAEGRWIPTAAVAGDTSWVERRPSPTIVGSFSPDVVAAPGYRKAGDGPRQSQPGSIRVSVAEAATLQTFPTDYVFCGSRTKQYEQCGNAIPPMLAKAILSTILTP